MRETLKIWAPTGFDIRRELYLGTVGVCLNVGISFGYKLLLWGFWLIKTATIDDSVILNSGVYFSGIILKAHYIKD